LGAKEEEEVLPFLPALCDLSVAAGLILLPGRKRNKKE